MIYTPKILLIMFGTIVCTLLAIFHYSRNKKNLSFTQGLILLIFILVAVAGALNLSVILVNGNSMPVYSTKSYDCLQLQGVGPGTGYHCVNETDKVPLGFLADKHEWKDQAIYSVGDVFGAIAFIIVIPLLSFYIGLSIFLIIKKGVNYVRV